MITLRDILVHPPCCNCPTSSPGSWLHRPLKKLSISHIFFIHSLKTNLKMVKQAFKDIYIYISIYPLIKHGDFPASHLFLFKVFYIYNLEAPLRGQESLGTETLVVTVTWLQPSGEPGVEKNNGRVDGFHEIYWLFYRDPVLVVI